MISVSVFGQNCPADLEWPSTSVASPGTTNLNSVVIWPASLETKSIVNDRHPNARTALLTPTTFAPSLGTTICDPVLNTSITRITPNGYSLTSDSFSAGGGWILAVGPSGSLVAFAMDAATGRPQLAGGRNRMVPISYELLPQSPGGTICPLSSAFWSKTEEGVIYIVGCGTRLFKYNLALYNASAPMAGLMAGSSSRSIARFPTCPPGMCRQGPVFLNFDDLFGAQANNGNLASLTMGVSEGDTTFSGFLTRGEGYKNVGGIVVFRPWNNSQWSSVAASSSVPLLASGRFNGNRINQRLIGVQTDRSGRYLTLATCADPGLNLYGCGSSNSFLVDLNLVSPTSQLAAVNPNGVDQLSHGAVGNGLRIGSNGSTQHLAVSYFSGTIEKKLLSLPDLANPSGWWGSYTDTGFINGASGYPLASVHSTYSYETISGSRNQYGSCPARFCLYGNELILFNALGTRFIRLAQNQSRIQEYTLSYWDLPRASLSRDGRFVIFVSNWGTPSTATDVRSAIYMARVPAAWRMLLDDTITVNTSATSMPPGAYTTLTVSHLRNANGANVLIQDAAQPAAVRSTACLFQVNKSGLMQLANDSGVFTNSMRGPIGSPSAGIVENSRCGLDLARSTVENTSNGNVIYRMSIYYKIPFLGKTIRAIAQTTGSSSWTDGTKMDVKAWAFSFAPISGGGRSDEEADAAPALPEYRSNETLEAGSSLEFPVEDTHPFQMNLTDGQSRVTLRVTRNAEGDSQLEVLEEENSLGTPADIKPGAMVRIDYRPDGRIGIVVDGADLVTANGPASRAGLYLVTDRLHPQLRLVSTE
ncbi:MAG: hypothetical protein MUF31_18975 [Akkermansiaceae bacterium]|nr:hypothetical protein [Akkermansiaceae bacterium]